MLNSIILKLPINSFISFKSLYIIIIYLV